MGKFRKYIRTLKGKKVNTFEVGTLLEVRVKEDSNSRKTLAVITEVNDEYFRIKLSKRWNTTHLDTDT